MIARRFFGSLSLAVLGVFALSACKPATGGPSASDPPDATPAPEATPTLNTQQTAPSATSLKLGPVGPVERAADAPAIPKPTATSGQQQPTCHESVAMPIYQGMGWTHFVDTKNFCDYDITCDISTSVDPTPTYRVTIRPNEVVRVAVRMGSPSREFEPIALCGKA